MDGRVLFVSIYPHGVAWNEGARTRIYIYTHAGAKRASVWQLRAPLCSTCSDRNYAKRRSPREREREREWGLPWKQVKKKEKGKRKKGGETVGEMEKELDKLVRKKKWLHAATTRLRKFCNLSRRSVWKIFEGEEEIDGEEYFRKVKIFLDRL